MSFISLMRRITDISESRFIFVAFILLWLRNESLNKNVYLDESFITKLNYRHDLSFGIACIETRVLALESRRHTESNSIKIGGTAEDTMLSRCLVNCIPTVIRRRTSEAILET
jgi:hypothetical protein